jgi:hypothetical protein
VGRKQPMTEKSLNLVKKSLNDTKITQYDYKCSLNIQSNAATKKTHEKDIR